MYACILQGKVRTLEGYMKGLMCNEQKVEWAMGDWKGYPLIKLL